MFPTPEPKLYITPSILTEYSLREGNPKWWMNFMADIALEESVLFGWINAQAKRDIGALHSEFPQLGSIACVDVELDRALRRMALRGLYMGIRRYTEVNTDMMGEISPLTNTHRAEGDSEPTGLPDTWNESGDFEQDDLNQ